MSSPLGAQIVTLARRSVTRTFRQPVLVVPNLLFPLFLLAVLSAGGKDVTKIHGFPTDSYITFLFGATLIQAATGAMTVAANGLGSDIETGFLSRLALTPMRSTALVAAQLAGVAVFVTVQAGVNVGVALAAGVHVKAGVAGGLALVGVAVLIGLAFGAIGLFAAARMGSAAQVQGLFAIALGLLFMSSMVMPRNLISSEWFKTVATYNPMSYLVEAARSLLIDGWDAQALERGCGIAAGAFVLAILATAVSLRRGGARA